MANQDNKKTAFDLLIVGAGPAGLSAAMQAVRQGLNIRIFEKGEPGGQVRAANWVENFPGMPEGIAGSELADRIVKQVMSHGIEIDRNEARSVKRLADGFIVQAGSCDFFSRSVIIAAGLEPEKLGVPGENELFGKGIFSYVDPSLLNVNKKHILIIGSGDAAFDQALSFTKRDAFVTVVMKHHEPRCIPALYESALASGVQIVRDMTVEKFETSNGNISAIFLDNFRMDTNIVVTCIGKKRNLNFISQSLLDEGTEGLFLAGDCNRKKDRHIAIACGDGVAAAMAAYDYITGLK